VFAGFRFPPEIIVLAVRWYLRFRSATATWKSYLPRVGSRSTTYLCTGGCSCFTPLLADAARPCSHTVGGRWHADETYVKVAGRWRYVYRAIDQYGQIIDVYVSTRRDTGAARRFFATSLKDHGSPPR
jgi:transposase, IS6 family